MWEEVDLHGCEQVWISTTDVERPVSHGCISTAKSLVSSNRGNRLSGWGIDLFFPPCHSLFSNLQHPIAVCFSPFSFLFFFCFYSFLLKWNWSWGSDSDRWLSALTLYPIRRRFHPIKNHLCSLKLNGSQAAERKGLPCVSELRKSNFLKAAAAVAGVKGSNSHDWPGPRLHTQFNPSQSAWHHINQPFISMPPKKKKKKKNNISIQSPLTEPSLQLTNREHQKTLGGSEIFSAWTEKMVGKEFTNRIPSFAFQQGAVHEKMFLFS